MTADSIVLFSLFVCFSFEVNEIDSDVFDRAFFPLQEYRRSMAMLDYIRNSYNGTATFGGYENRHR